MFHMFYKSIQIINQWHHFEKYTHWYVLAFIFVWLILRKTYVHEWKTKNVEIINV